MDRSIVIGLASFALTASVLAIPTIAQSHQSQTGHGAAITRAQMETRLAERFAAADGDGNGTLSRAEAEAHRASRNAARQTRIFDRMDGDGDGRITLAEHQAAHADGHHPRRHRQRQHPERGQSGGTLRDSMIVENRNMRARLTPEELAPLTEGASAEERSNMQMAERPTRADRMRARWAAADANGDDALDRTEFAAMHWAHHGRMGNRQANWFSRMDRDGDGRLTQAEMSARALARFDRTDSNGDGIVTREERRAARQARHQGDHPES